MPEPSIHSNQAYPLIYSKPLPSMGAVFPDLQPPNSGSTPSWSGADSRRVDHTLQPHAYGLRFVDRTANNETMRFFDACALARLVVSGMCFAGTESDVVSAESQRISIALSLGTFANPLGSHWLILR